MPQAKDDSEFLKAPKAQKALLFMTIVLIGCFYLIFDFNMLEKRIANGDESWGTAVQIAVNIYLDIINLFLYILRALAESN